MTAAWEQQQKPFLTICVPHTGEVSIEWAFAVMHLRQPPRTMWSLTSGAPWDVSRSQMVQKALESGSEWVMMLDSDVIPPPDAIEKLLSWNLPIVSGLYYRRYPRAEVQPGQEFHPSMWKLIPADIKIKCPTCGIEHQRGEGKYTPIVNFPDGALIETDVVGMGCCLIHRRVFEKIREKFPRPHDPEFKIYPWFEWLQGWFEGQCSEDFVFCEKAKDCGFKIFVDSSTKCGHAFTGKVVHPGRVVYAVV